MMFPFPLEQIPIPISSPKLLPFPWESHGNPTEMGILISVHTSSTGQRRQLSQRDRATRSLPVTFNQRVAGNDDGTHCDQLAAVKLR